jgi:beta-galactosidase/beta-glucuronidase
MSPSPGRSGRPLPLRLSARLAVAAAIACGGLAMVPRPAIAADVPPTGAVYRDGPSGRYLLAGDWHVRADPTDQGRKARWQRARSLAGWAPTTVPNAANAGDFSEQSYLGSVYWYRKDFRLPRAPGGSRWIFRFESVNYRATVWLNGRQLGSHTGPFLPFEIQAQDLDHNGDNRLVVRVDSRRGTLDVPSLGIRRDGRYIGGWWNYTGILREVYLRQVKRFDFSDVLVRTRLPCRHCDATIDVTATVANLGNKSALATIEGRAARRDLLFKAAAVPGNGTRRFKANLRLQDPRLWSPERPSLYKVRLLVRRDDGEVVQRYSVRIGIRRISVSSTGRLLINYRPVNLRGASMHEDDAVTGSALQPDAIRQNVALLRDLGATMTRSHYPLHPLTLELADRYGIVVWSEIPVYQMQDMLFRNAGVRKQSLQMLEELIHRDRNHPSVLVWSVGNENTSRPGPGFVRYVRQAKHLARRLDPTRLVGLAFPGYPTIGRQALYTELDALGVNDYFGWYPGPENSIARREDLGPYLDRLHSEYPGQALFVTEFGAEANRSGPASEKGTFEFQRDFLAYHLQVFSERPFLNAALVWILRDFRVKPFYDGGNPIPDPPNNRKGLVDLAGQKKLAFETVREIFGGPRGATE